MSIKILAFAGSLRKDSLNKKLLANASAYARAQGFEVEVFDLGEIPVYNQDIEDTGLPQSVIRFKTAIQGADLLMISAPEYNHGISGVLKNAIDWATRPDGDNPFSGKVGILMGASDGRFGTARGQIDVRKLLVAVDLLTIPQPYVYVAEGDKQFDAEGNLINEKNKASLEKLIARGIAVAEKLKN
ncbi:MAG: hypothetical protein A3J48_03760 [Candidatus Doudnabacteria bacterium RIFCSPHIGHO2_02_FULL_46_11]|uniref:NADPH-dependent FMN reductase-like domain-containing protein n=1 Tax=Candidatus Doudnabacteria bacterium RIFCSPHIGHO2_02_FULL_46_11 TaxID=1817832 RepID=A0A1F5P430_9BACT|nr:MAG: hypothetical protein A3J48_03760 [Candidatus Doudnabacteria bacterium RIFCSPHIGHO2_02_FULL_46_11]